MATQLLLIVIYLAFISLGLPDSLLGAAWPSMYRDLSVPSQYAGIISMIVAAGTVISSLFSSFFIRKFGVAVITIVSVMLTALALMGFAYSRHFIFLCLLAIPLGIGAGSIDAALNNYVALHYKARHMNWLHCFWGVGAAIGPMIMSGYLAVGRPWSMGYKTVGYIQLALVLILLCTYSLWNEKKSTGSDAEPTSELKKRSLLSVPGLKQVLCIFFCYCTIEACFGLWGATYLVIERGVMAGAAAQFVSLYYWGITIGRFMSGFISDRMGNQRMVYIGQAIIFTGLLLLFIPADIFILPAFFLVGLGCAPIFPALLHETPQNFGQQHSQSIMGLQMAAAYVGITVMPLLFGEIAARLGYGFLAWFLVLVLAAMVLVNSFFNKIISNNQSQG